MHFDHEKLEVYKVSLEFISFASNIIGVLKGDHRRPREQLIRSSQSIPLKIAEGNGKRSFAERRRYFEIARGSAMESAANLDVLVCCGACSTEQVEPGKALLVRVGSTPSRMTEPRQNAAKEDERDYGNGKAAFDYDYEHEHERTDEDPGP